MITTNNENNVDDGVDDDGNYDASFYSSVILTKMPILRNTS
jgi:hypothetical protein